MYDTLPNFALECSKIWTNDDTHTKFKMGQKVLVDGEVFTIIGVNPHHDEETEYATKEYEYLFWEHELKEIPDNDK